jgi:hypothetical protein
MAKNKEKRKLPKASEVPAVKPLLAEVEKRKAIVAKAKAKATKDGKFNKYDPKYRQSIKQLKKLQRTVVKEIKCHPAPPKPAEAKPEAAPAAPAQ